LVDLLKRSPSSPNDLKGGCFHWLKATLREGIQEAGGEFQRKEKEEPSKRRWLVYEKAQQV